MVVRTLAAILAMVVWTSATAADPAALQRDYAAAKAIVERDLKAEMVGIGHSPTSAPALEREWTIAAGWLAASVDGAATIDAKRAAEALHRLDPALDTETLPLTPGVVAVSLGHDQLGTVVVFANSDGHWRAVWNIREEAELGRFPLLGAWTAAGAKDNCRDRKADGAWDRCGAMNIASLSALPADSQGRPRFFVDSNYAQIAGETESYQLSIWTWDGSGAVPQLVKPYAQMLETVRSTKPENGLLHIDTKEEFRTFFSCGACEGRQMVWTIRIKPDGVEDLGATSTMPELDAVDALFDAMAHGQSTANLAAVKMVATLAPIVRQAKADSSAIDKNYFSLGMLEDHDISHNGGKTTVCFLADDSSHYLLFTLERRKHGYFTAGVKNPDDINAKIDPCSHRKMG
jgi:hypothetical protein